MTPIQLSICCLAMLADYSSGGHEARKTGGKDPNTITGRNGGVEISLLLIVRATEYFGV